jgi:hypothetical protein
VKENVWLFENFKGLVAINSCSYIEVCFLEDDFEEVQLHRFIIGYKAFV